jgi:acetylglutamate kinase
LQNDQVIPSLTTHDAEALIKSKIIFGGMIPKVCAALDAIAGGAQAARITNLEGLIAGAGTMFVPNL